MKTVNASHFKTHFGEVLNAALKKPVRVKRRGQPATVLLHERDYLELKNKFDQHVESRKFKALEELHQWVEISVKHKDLSSDARAQAIIGKHGKHWNEVDLILTRTPKDFLQSPIKVLTPEEFSEQVG